MHSCQHIAAYVPSNVSVHLVEVSSGPIRFDGEVGPERPVCVMEEYLRNKTLLANFHCRVSRLATRNRIESVNT